LNFFSTTNSSSSIRDKRQRAQSILLLESEQLTKDSADDAFEREEYETALAEINKITQKITTYKLEKKKKNLLLKK